MVDEPLDIPVEETIDTQVSRDPDGYYQGMLDCAYAITRALSISQDNQDPHRDIAAEIKRHLDHLELFRPALTWADMDMTTIDAAIAAAKAE